MTGRIVDARFQLISLLTICVLASCATSRAPASVTPPSGASTVVLPAGFHTESKNAATPGPKDWVRVSSLSMDSTLAEIRASYDASTFQAFDPWLGIPTTPVVEQQVFVRSKEAPRVKSDPKSWTDRFVVQRMPFPGESSFSSRAFALWTIEDLDRQRCHEGLTRKLLTVTPSEMLYESKFSNCPEKFPLGPNRVVLTRELMGQKSWRAGVQQIYIFSYEVTGSEMTSLQREQGMKLIGTPHLAAAGEGGTRLLFSGSEPGDAGVMGMP